MSPTRRTIAGRDRAAESAFERGRLVPGPRGRRLIGCLMEVRRNRLAFVRRSFRDFGDAAAFRMGPKRLFLMAHPEAFRHVLCHRPENFVKGVGLREARPLLGDGLLTAEGEAAAAERRRLRPAFDGSLLAGYARAMTEAAGAMLDRWSAATEACLAVDREMVRLALEVLDRTLLDSDLTRRADALHGDLVEMTDWAMRRMSGLLPWPLALPGGGNGRARRALRHLEAWAREAVEGRAGKALRADVIGLLLADGRSPGEIRDELLTFLLAGHETTAVTLSWALSLVARHPEVAARLEAEVDEVLRGRPPAPDDLPALPFTRAVIDETLRLYPPVWLIPRRSLRRDLIAGWRIPGGSDVLLNVYSLHRHPDFWDDPERFRPERFMAPAQAVPRAYLPFGAGNRSCLGSGFGLLEVRLVVAMVAQRFHLEAVDEVEVPPLPSLTLRPTRPIRVRLAARAPELRRAAGAGS